MKPSRVLSFLLALSCLASLRADEDVFLSLTRSAEPVDRMPTNVTVVTAEEIRRSGAVTLADALQDLPSVQALKTATPGQFSSVRVRGVPSSNQVQVVVDDQPLGGVYLQDLDIGQIPVDNIERIEIVRGGSSVLYGANTIGGVIHVITKKAAGARPSSSVGYEAGSFRTQVHRAEIRYPGPRTDASLSASTYRTDGFQQNADADGLSVTGSVGRSFESGARLSLEATRVDTDAGDPQGTPVPLDQWDGKREKTPVNAKSRVSQGNTLARVRAVTPLGAGSLQTLFYGSHQNYLNDDPINFFLSEINKNALGNDTRLLLPGRWTLGASYERDEYRSKGSAKLHGVDWGLYTEKTFSAGSLDLSPAVRLDQHGTFGNTVNPRMTLVWRISDGLKASANAGRSFRSPTLVDLNQSFPAALPALPFFAGYSAFLANASLRPETAWTYDAGVEVKTGERSALSLTGFHTRIRDRITATNNPYPVDNSLINAPQAEITGVEAELMGRWGPLVHRVGGSVQRAMGNSLASSHFVPLRRTPRRQAHARLTWEAPRGWALMGESEYQSQQFEADNEAGLKIPGRVLWNARLSKTILRAELYLTGENLTNQRTADAFGFSVLAPRPGRTLSGGITIRFQD